MTCRRWLAVAVGLVFIPAVGWALDPSKALTQYTHEVWLMEDGLPQNSIYSLVQTPDGYLWLGTGAGLVRFDGVRFTVYDYTNTPAIGNNHVYAVAEDGSGGLLVGTNGGGVIRYREGGFWPFEAQAELPSLRVTALSRGTDGDIWIGTYDAGAARWDGERLERVGTTGDDLPSGIVWSVVADRRGGAWIGILGGGVHHYDAAGRHTAYHAADGLASDYVWGLYLAEDETLWVGTTHGLSRLRDDRFETLTTGDGLTRNWIKGLIEDRDGSLWIGTQGGGLNRRHGNTVGRMVAPAALSGDIIWSLLVDREGNLWVGTLGSGLHRLSDRSFVPYSHEEGLSSRQTHAIVEDNDGGLWIGTNSGGINRLDDGRVRRFDAADGASSETSWSLLHDRSGGLWVGTGGSGVDRFADGVWRNFTTEDGLASNWVVDLLEDDWGTIWIATGRGLTRYGDGEFTSYTSRDGLPSDRVEALLRDGEGGLWIGTVNGLAHYDLSSFTVYTTADGLSSNRVRALYQDDEGVLWIGTFGGGLNRLKNGAIASFTGREGFFGDTISEIVEDDEERLWICSHQGILMVAKAELEAVAAGTLDAVNGVAFGRQDGLRSPGCFSIGHPSAIRARDGRLWFATLDGAAVIDPGRLAPVAIPEALIEGITLEGERSLLEDGSELPARTRSVELHYTATTLTVSDKIRFRRRLLGFHEDWRDVGSSRDADYTNLDPGAYRFEVMASDEHGRFRGEPASVSFTVRPAFTQTWTFLTLCALLLVGLGSGAQQLRVRQLRRREEELSRRVAEAVANLKVLGGLLPICAWCKKIRDDDGYWRQLEVYIHRHSEASFTHGLCPQCASRVGSRNLDEGRPSGRLEDEAPPS